MRELSELELAEVAGGENIVIVTGRRPPPPGGDAGGGGYDPSEYTPPDQDWDWGEPTEPDGNEDQHAWFWILRILQFLRTPPGAFAGGGLAVGFGAWVAPHERYEASRPIVGENGTVLTPVMELPDGRLLWYSNQQINGVYDRWLSDPLDPATPRYVIFAGGLTDGGHAIYYIDDIMDNSPPTLAPAGW